jgi:hypothetical protein
VQLDQQLNADAPDPTVIESLMARLEALLVVGDAAIDDGTRMDTSAAALGARLNADADVDTNGNADVVSSAGVHVVCAEVEPAGEAKEGVDPSAAEPVAPARAAVALEGQEEPLVTEILNPDDAMEILNPDDAMGRLNPDDALGRLSDPDDTMGRRSDPDDAMGRLSDPDDAMGRRSDPDDAMGRRSEAEAAEQGARGGLCVDLDTVMVLASLLKADDAVLAATLKWTYQEAPILK